MENLKEPAAAVKVAIRGSRSERRQSHFIAGLDAPRTAARDVCAVLAVLARRAERLTSPGFARQSV